MFLYRIAHNDVAYRMRLYPEEGYLYFRKLPFFIAFDSISAAILESHIHRAAYRFPAGLGIVEYTGAHEATIRNYTSEPIFEKSNGFMSLSDSAKLFLSSNSGVIASFPSPFWKNIHHYLVNPQHKHFRKIVFSRTSHIV